MIDFSKVPFPDGPVGATNGTGTTWSLPDPAPFVDDPGAVVDLNLDGAKRALKLFEDGISKIEKKAKELEVNTAETAEIATEMAAQTLRLGDKIDERRKEIIDVPDKYVRGINAFVKPMQDRIKAVAGKGGILKRKLSDYNTRLLLEQRELERKQREAAERLQAELDAEAKAKNVAPVQVAPVAVPMGRGPIRSASGSSSSKMVTFPEIIDLSLVPRPYLEGIFKKKSDVDGDDPLDGATEAIWSRLRTLLSEAHTAGLRDIPGVNFKEKADVSIRRSA